MLAGKFGRERSTLRETLNELLQPACRVRVAGTVRGACRDPNDDAILETAVAARADLLIAGDKDLLSLRSFQNIDIVTPAAYLRLGR